MPMEKEKKVTLRHVAALAKVSDTAVSMILNQTEGVSFAQETIDRVFAAAEELNYKTKTMKSIKRGSAILVICPNVSNPYYAAIVQAIEQSASHCGYQICICNTYRDEAKERFIMETILDEKIVGVIFTMIPANIGLIEKINKDVPVVIVGDSDVSIKMDTVETNNYLAGVLMGQHLLALGHRHIAYISSTLNATNTARTKRLEGLTDTLHKYLQPTKLYIKESVISPAEERMNILLEHNIGYKLTKSLLSNTKITAFVAVNDMVAYGVMDTLLSQGYSVPKDYSVSGFDNDFPSRFMGISLTTVEHGMEEKGHNAFEILYRKINKKSQKNNNDFITRIEYQQQLIVRNSTGPVRTNNENHL